MNNVKQLDICKILLLLVFISILVIINIIAQNQGVRGYEISIYNEYPASLWYLIILCILICQIIIFMCIFSKVASSMSWKLACTGMVICNSILLFIPLIRRYAIYGNADPSSHMGYMLDILQTGHAVSNKYPIVHILGVISHEICGLDLNIFMLMYPWIYYLIYVTFFYLIYRIFLDCRPSILAGMMVAPLLFAKFGNISFTPQALSNYFSLVLLYLFFKRSDLSNNNVACYSILICIASYVITFGHPLTSLFLIVTISIFEVSYHILKQFNLYSVLWSYRSASNLILIMIIIFGFWSSYVRVFLNSFYKVFLWLHEDTISTSAFEERMDQISEFDPGISYILNSFIHVYGLWLLYMLMGVVSIIVIFKAWKKKVIYLDNYILTLITGFIAYFIFYLYSQFVVKGTGYVRIGHYAIIASLYLIPIAIGHVLERDIIEKKNAKSICKQPVLIFFSIFIICITYLSVYSLYGSPITKTTGAHVPDSWLIGMDTFFEIRYDHIWIIEGGISIERIRDSLYGIYNPLSTSAAYPRVGPPIPNHFNYNNDNTNLVENYDKQMYIIISKLFRILYPNMLQEYPSNWRFNQTDFLMLENDKSVLRVYSNAELDVYLLKIINEELAL